MLTLYSNIKNLIGIEEDAAQKKIVKGAEMKHLPMIEDAWMLTDGQHILDFGSMQSLPEKQVDREENLNGASVLPVWVDSHTHLVFAHSREQEFVDRIHGLSYEEIAKRGGGILNSARKLNEADEGFLYEQAMARLEEVKNLGTGAIEIGSGYGLNTQAEIKMLRVIRRIKETAGIPVKATFLGAHAYPMEFRENHQAYLDIVIQEMLPQIADEGLADYMDVFCEKGFFSADETAQ